MEQTAAVTLLQQFLSWQQQPDAALALWQCYSTSAMVLVDGQVLAKSQLEAARFYRQHQQRAAQPNLPQYRILSLLNCQIEPEQQLVWCQLAVEQSEPPLYLAAGLKWEQGDWHLDWCCLSLERQNWSYQQGYLQSLAEYPWLLATQPWLPRSGLDASWLRLFPQPMDFTTLPEARFSCHMNSTCCRHEFGIVLPAAAQQLIDALPWSQIDPELSDKTLPVRADGQLQLKLDRQDCRFLDQRGHCRIHQHLGRQPFGPCAVFPMQFTQTPTGVAVSLSSVCGSVRQQLGQNLAERRQELSERWFLAQVRPLPEAFWLAPGYQLDWTGFSQVEAMLLELLEQSAWPLYRRLYLMNRLLAALRQDQPPDWDGWLQQPLAELDAGWQQQLEAYLHGILSWDRKPLLALAGQAIPPLQHQELEQEAQLVGILRNTVFSKVYSYQYDLTTANNLMIVLYLLTLVCQKLQPKPLPAVFWDELASMGSHGLLKSLLPATSAPALTELLASNEFGDWALALAR